MRFSRLCSSIMLVLAGLCCQARQPMRPVNSAWMIEAGSSHIADTYLSPVKYSGVHLGVTYNRLQAMRQHVERLSQGLEFSLNFDRAKNPAGNSTMMALRLDASWRLLWRGQIGSGFSGGIGGYAGGNVGVVTQMRNGNNPAQAQAALSIGPEGYVQWSGTIGRRMPLTVRWQASTPLLGAFFCPDYGELYYEIYLGNRSGLCHFGWPGNRRRVRSLLSADIHLGSTTLRLGYRLDATSAKANHITSRCIEHAAVIGIVCDYISINTRKKVLEDAKIVTAYY